MAIRHSLDPVEHQRIADALASGKSITEAKNNITDATNCITDAPKRITVTLDRAAFELYSRKAKALNTTIGGYLGILARNLPEITVKL